MQKGEVTWRSGSTLFKQLVSIWCYLILILILNLIIIIISGNNFTIANELSYYANVSHSWKNNINIEGRTDSFPDNSVARSVLFSQSKNATYYPSVGFGFFAQEASSSYILAIYMEKPRYSEYPQTQEILWIANRDHPVRENATLNLTSGGDLILRDADGSFVWSTNTSGLSVRSVRLNDDGNLLLLNGNGETIWESYRYPTDTLISPYYLPLIAKGQKVISRISTSNYSTGNYYLEVHATSNTHFHIAAYVDLNPPQQYRYLSQETIMKNYDKIRDGVPFVYERLDQDGHLNMFGFSTMWSDTLNNTDVQLGDLFEDQVFGDCAYPTTCGRYGVCIGEKECYCPAGSSDDSFVYFTPKEGSRPNLGCNLVTPLSCPNTNNLHHFIDFPNVTYFDSTPSLTGTDIEHCKTACLKQCSCKAAFFRYFDDPSSGNCTLHIELLTLMDVSKVSVDYKAVASIKVQKPTQNTTFKEASNKKKILLYLSASFTALVLVIGVCWCLLIKQRSKTKEIDHCLDVFIDTVDRFSYQSLKLATQDFKTKLGQGGFGSVFEGTLEDGTKVAVKLLESSSQGRKEFLAEVNTIGSFHHFNLVRLIGFCDDGVNRLLVYEYMCNGSLNKWIFNQEVPQKINWNIRRRIIEGMAAGLEYLHEHCKQNVIHFDIKPHNILLDKDFNVKIADFGLAKMVDRDQSQVMTMVRGTPGYMAPELINGRAISVKVDVYSFGVVVLEIVCGRKNFGRSEGDILTNLVKLKADEDQLSDLIDLHAEDMQQNKEEVVNMMRIAIWCLQPHFIRPNMSKVVKVLQDLSNTEALNDLSDLTMVHETNAEDASYKSKYHPTDSHLSGPR